MKNLFWCRTGFCAKVSFYMDGNKILKSINQDLIWYLNYNQYLSVSLGSLSYITTDVIKHSIQCSLLFTGFTPQIAAEKQVK